MIENLTLDYCPF